MIMDIKQIIEDAKEAGFNPHPVFGGLVVRHSNGSWIDISNELLKFAELTLKRASDEAKKNILETDDGKWDGVIRAFWRRIQGYKKCEYNDVKDLPDPLPVEFRAHFATALLASPIRASLSANEQDAIDAERYRFLRNADLTVMNTPCIAIQKTEKSGKLVNGEDADEAIDQAISNKKVGV